MLSESEEELDFEEQVDLFHGGAHGGPIDHHMEQALLFGDNVDVGHFPMEGDEGGEPLVGQNPPDQPPDEAEQPLDEANAGQAAAPGVAIAAAPDGANAAAPAGDNVAPVGDNVAAPAQAPAPGEAIAVNVVNAQNVEPVSFINLLEHKPQNPTEEKYPEPVGLGQRIVAKPGMQLGLSENSRQLLKEEYAKHKGVFKPPGVDLGLASTLRLTKWPKQVSKNLKKNPGGANISQARLKEAELYKLHLELGDLAKPSVSTLDDLNDMPDLDVTSKAKLAKKATDTLQMISEKIRRITEQRRRNILEQVFDPDVIEKLMSPSQYGGLEETKVNLFGQTWINKLEPYLGLRQGVRKALSQGGGKENFTSQNQSAKRPAPAATATSGYVLNYTTNVGFHNSIQLRVNNTLQNLNLPCVNLPLEFHNTPDVTYSGARLPLFLKNWELVTQNGKVLSIVKGSFIDFDKIPKDVIYSKGKTHPSAAESAVVQKLLKNRVIEQANTQGVVSNIFLRLKESGEHRLILNLSILNKMVTYKKFKMQSIKLALFLSKPGFYYIKIDLKGAYDTVAIARIHRRYLQFFSGNTLYQYRGFPNGLAEAPRKFTLLLTPILSWLSFLGIIFVSYLDDMLIMGEDPELLLEQAAIAVQFFIYLGFIINIEKSVTSPAQQIEFLGFILDSSNQTLTLPTKKVEKVITKCKAMLAGQNCTKRGLAMVIGTLHSCALAVYPAPLHYRELQAVMNLTIGEWDASVVITMAARRDLTWWTENLKSHNGTPWVQPEATMVIETDASKTGWGATSMNQEAQDFWNPEEAKMSINTLETLAIQRGLQALVKVTNITVQVKTDNTTALAYIGKMGGTKKKHLSDIAVKTWEWAQERGIRIKCQHIPGRLNERADKLSRIVDKSDWMLKKSIFRKIDRLWGPHRLDAFARDWNKQVPKFFAWKGHPKAVAIDALNQKWPKTGAYAFPPYIVIPKVLRLIRQQKLESVTLIAPLWRTQCWFSTLLRMSIDIPVKLPPSAAILTNSRGQPDSWTHHLAAWHLSGIDWLQQEFLQRLQKPCPINRGNLPLEHMTLHGTSGVAGIWKGKEIPLKHVSQLY